MTNTACFYNNFFDSSRFFCIFRWKSFCEAGLSLKHAKQKSISIQQVIAIKSSNIIGVAIAKVGTWGTCPHLGAYIVT